MRIENRIDAFLTEATAYDIQDVVDYMNLYDYDVERDFGARTVKTRENYAMLRSAKHLIEISYRPKVWSWNVIDLKTKQQEIRNSFPFESMVSILKDTAKHGVAMTPVGLKKLLDKAAPGGFEYVLDSPSPDLASGILVTSTEHTRQQINWFIVTIKSERRKELSVAPLMNANRFAPAHAHELKRVGAGEVVSMMRKFQSTYKDLMKQIKAEA